FRERIESLAVGNRFEPARRPATNRLVITIGDRQVHAGIPVRRRAEGNGVFGEAEAPGVVVARTDKFQRRAIGLEAKDSLPESDFLPANRAAKSGIPDGAPNPVIETIAQVAGRRMRVPHAPTGEEHLPLVRLAVPVRVLKELRLAGMDDDDTAVGEDKT